MRRNLVLILALLAPGLAHSQTQLTIQQLPTEFAAATPITMTPAASSLTFRNDGREFLWVVNAGSSQITVTVEAIGPSDQGFTTDAVYEVPAGQLAIIEALSMRRFNDRRTGLVTLTFSATSSVTVAVVRMPHARP